MHVICLHCSYSCLDTASWYQVVKEHVSRCKVALKTAETRFVELKKEWRNSKDVWDDVTSTVMQHTTSMRDVAISFFFTRLPPSAECTQWKLERRRALQVAIKKYCFANIAEMKQNNEEESKEIKDVCEESN